MKRLIGAALLLLTAAVPRAQAFPGDEVIGGAVGGGLGWVVARHSHGIRPEIAIPVGALAGAWVGHEFRHERRRVRYYDDDWYRPWSGAFWPTVCERTPSYGYEREVRYVEVVHEAPPPVQPSPVTEAVVPADPHPGIDLIKVQVRSRNGLPLDVRILRIGDKFVGPQGEEYASLPTAAQLEQKYGF